MFASCCKNWAFYKYFKTSDYFEMILMNLKAAHDEIRTSKSRYENQES